jgi:hypothetical protein
MSLNFTSNRSLVTNRINIWIIQRSIFLCLELVLYNVELCDNYLLNNLFHENKNNT